MMSITLVYSCKCSNNQVSLVTELLHQKVSSICCNRRTIEFVYGDWIFRAGGIFLLLDVLTNDKVLSQKKENIWLSIWHIVNVYLLNNILIFTRQWYCKSYYSNKSIISNSHRIRLCCLSFHYVLTRELSSFSISWL